MRGATARRCSMLGATGPVASEKRRPWIDWIHTSRDNGAYIRSHRQVGRPADLGRCARGVDGARATCITRTAPTAPVYIVLDAGFQETKLDKEPEWPDVKRFQPPKPPRAVEGGARPGRRPSHRTRRSRSSCSAAGRARTSIGSRASVSPSGSAPACSPISSRARCSRATIRTTTREPFNAIVKEARELMCEADVILSLDWMDLGGALRQAKNVGDGEGQDHPLLARPEPAHRRQHGVPGAAAGRRVCGDDRRRDGRRAQRGARRRPQGSVEGEGAGQEQGGERRADHGESSPRRCATSSTIRRT